MPLSEKSPRRNEGPRRIFRGDHPKGPGIAVPGSAAGEALRVLRAQAERVSDETAFSLIRLLELLHSGGIPSRRCAEIPMLLDNFLELWTERRKEMIALACRVFFKDISYPESRVDLPEGMIQALIHAGRREDSDRVKGKIWEVLMKTVPQLQRRISPSDLAFGLWLTDPVSRGNMTRYLFTHWHPGQVLEATLGQIARSRATDVPATLPDREGSTLGKRHKTRVIIELLMGSGLLPKEKQRLFSALAETLTRFDLIRVLPLFSEKPSGVENGVSHQRQMHFAFARSGEEALLDTVFGERTKALLEAH